MPSTDRPDIVLIGAGIMSATFATVIKHLAPSLDLMVFETLGDCAQESSDGWNNAGTGHAANCEMNYTPQRKDGSVDISKALEVNTEFDLSRQLWAFLVDQGAIPDPSAFINPCPHMSFVWGAENVAFLKTRFGEMSANHCYHGMEYTEDPKQIADWAPLIMDGRDGSDPVAATRMATGTDVDYGTLTHLLVKHLQGQGVQIHYDSKVTGLEREADGRWRVTAGQNGSARSVSARFVFVGAGGGSLPLLQMSKIPEGKGYGGFPVSGIWLRCDADEVVRQHKVKVYGKAASGSPPMSVPHLDARIVEGQHSLLFGPYAGFSTRFLKHGKLLDLFESLTPNNLIPLMDVARDNVDLSEYLVGQVLQSAAHQFETLKQFFPRAQRKQWREDVAGMRVQTIKPHETAGWFKHEAGGLEFGTELVVAGDKSMAVLLGASPGASTAAFIALEVLRACFADQLTDDAWLPRLTEMIPTYGIDLKRDADACRRTRAATAKRLKTVDIA